jgi:metal-sulfur cluster biosynthetic enzyme
VGAGARSIGRHPRVHTRKLDVELELYPPWDPSRMSEAAKLQLGIM